MIFNWKAGLITFISCMLCGACSYIAGHTAAMHQHASINEQNKLIRNENGEISYKKYIIEAFKDHKRMQDDPLGLNKTLD